MPEQDKNKKHGDGPHRWKKGESGNPKGRPKGLSLGQLLDQEIEAICPQDKEERSWKQLIVMATLQLAIKGHNGALNQVWDRLDGKVPQGLIGGNGEALTSAITVKLINSDLEDSGSPDS